MKRFSILLCLALIGTKAQSQIKAVTETGREVILNNDNTWRYANQEPSYDTRLDTLSFKKNANATFLVKSEKAPFGFYVNPKAWNFKLNENDANPFEYIFTLKGEDVYAFSIPERVELSYESLREVALVNQRKAALDARITREEVRNVNGNIVHLLEIHSTIKGTKFVYLGYYYSCNNGTLQFVCVTSENLLKRYKQNMEDLLNGFVMLKNKSQES